MRVVYAHYFRGVPVYVGYGGSCRPRNFHARTWAWRMVFMPQGTMPRWIDVRILSCHRFARCARRRERQLIYKWRPLCNIKVVASTPKTRAETIERLISLTRNTGANANG